MTEVKKDLRIQKQIEEYNLHLNSVADTQVGLVSPTVCDVCKNARKAAESFCKVCKEFLCVDCQTAHKGSEASRDHQLVDFLQLCEEKQIDIKTQMKKLQDANTDVKKDKLSAQSLSKQIEESEVEVIEEINKYRKAIIERVDRHHDQLIQEVKSINNRLQETLKETEKMLEQCEQKLEGKVSFLSQVSVSQDYSLMMDTLSNLSEQIEKDLQQIQFELPKVTTDVLPVISVRKGEEFDPTKSTRISVGHSTVESPKGLTSVVGGIFCDEVINVFIYE